MHPKKIMKDPKQDPDPKPTEKYGRKKSFRDPPNTDEGLFHKILPWGQYIWSVKAH